LFKKYFKKLLTLSAYYSSIRYKEKRRYEMEKYNFTEMEKKVLKAHFADAF